MPSSPLTAPTPVEIVAPSGCVVPWELERGLNRLRDQGFMPRVNEGISGRWFVFAGDDATRAAGFWAAATSRDSRIVWAARGGYGAARILPELERLTRLHGPPPRKLLCGYSDITALHAFVRYRWHWATLHCDMPASSRFAEGGADFDAAVRLVRGEGVQAARPAWCEEPLSAYGKPGATPLEGVLAGGNLTVLTTLIGTPYRPRFPDRDAILFLEDVSEAPYRIDRYLNQLVQSDFFNDVRAVVLGTFDDCDDQPSTTIRPDGTSTTSRPKMSPAEWRQHVFSDLSLRVGVPVFYTLPVGHGPERAPLPLHARCRVRVGEPIELLSWDWPPA